MYDGVKLLDTALVIALFRCLLLAVEANCIGLVFNLIPALCAIALFVVPFSIEEYEILDTPLLLLALISYSLWSLLRAFTFP